MTRDISPVATPVPALRNPVELSVNIAITAFCTLSSSLSYASFWFWGVGAGEDDAEGMEVIVTLGTEIFEGCGVGMAVGAAVVGETHAAVRKNNRPDPNKATALFFKKHHLIGEPSRCLV